jgi:uncharacterized membrane protein
MRILRKLAGPLFIFTGVLHFVIPKPYEQIVPDYLPAHRTLVYVSGVAEAAGGAAMMHPKTRRYGGWWLVATLIAVFPANINMALHPDRFKQIPGGAAALWARLPLQGLFIAWVLAAMAPSPGSESRTAVAPQAAAD